LKRGNLGRYGESLAAEYLENNHYEILQRNWRFRRYGEIDIIAYLSNKQCLSFIEVKSRNNNKFGLAVEAVSTRQQSKIRFLAEVYLSQHVTERSYKTISFDLITVTQFTNITPVIEHYESAF
jgi:putative endonuclease